MTEETQNPIDENPETTAAPAPDPLDEAGDAIYNDEQSPAEAADAPKEEPSPLALAQARIAEYDDRYKRLFAEFENFRRRTAKERLDMIQGANADLLRDLLPVVDDLARAVQAGEAGQDPAAFLEGVKLVQAKLGSTLERKGLKSFDSKGQPFDADKHEAITQIPAPTEDLKNKVVDEIERGYTLGEKVLRFAKVVVGQ